MIDIWIYRYIDLCISKYIYTYSCKEMTQEKTIWTIKSLLGQGAFSTVYIVEDGDGKKGALKTMNDKFDNFRFLDELMILESLRLVSCQNLIQIYDSFPTEKKIVMEYNDRSCTLTHWINTNKRHNYESSTNRKNIMSGIGRGLQTLHANNIIHLDIKPDNIIIASGIPKIIDFGNSLRKPEDRRWPIELPWSILRGTRSYAAPETLGFEKYSTHIYSPSADAWSYGCVIYILFSLGCSPFTGFELDKISKGEYPYKRVIPRQINNMIRSLLQPLRANRLLIENINLDLYLNL